METPASTASTQQVKRKKKGDIWSSKVLQNSEQSALTLEQMGINGKEIKGKDLWLVQVPRDLDIHTLDGVQLQLENSSVQSTEDQSLQINVLKQSGSTFQSQSIVLIPTSKPGKLRAVSGTTGQLSVFLSTATPRVELPPPGPPKGMDAPEGLKQRWKPFGCDGPSSTLVKHDTSSEKHHGNLKKLKISKTPKSQKH